jgi:hypothetical protein
MTDMVFSQREKVCRLPERGERRQGCNAHPGQPTTHGTHGPTGSPALQRKRHAQAEKEGPSGIPPTLRVSIQLCRPDRKSFTGGAAIGCRAGTRHDCRVLYIYLIIVLCSGEWLVGLRRFSVRFGVWGEKLNAEARSKDLRRGGDQVWAVISGFRSGRGPRQPPASSAPPWVLRASALGFLLQIPRPCMPARGRDLAVPSHWPHLIGQTSIPLFIKAIHQTWY